MSYENDTVGNMIPTPEQARLDAEGKELDSTGLLVVGDTVDVFWPSATWRDEVIVSIKDMVSGPHYILKGRPCCTVGAARCKLSSPPTNKG